MRHSLRGRRVRTSTFTIPHKLTRAHEQRRRMFLESLEPRALMAADAFNDAGVTSENSILTSVSPGATTSLLTNDTGGPLTVTSFETKSALGATVNVNPDGTFSYNPTAAPALQKLGDSQSVLDSFTYTVRDNVFPVDNKMRVQLLTSTGTVPNNDTNNWLSVYNALDSGAGPTGKVAGFDIVNNVSDTETAFNYPTGTGNFGGDLALDSINNNGPGGAGGPFNGGDNYSVRARTFLRFTTSGTFTIGMGSDDGRRIKLTAGYPGSAPGYSGFSAIGDQVNGAFTAGDTVFGFSGGTGHAWSVGTFAVAAGDILALDAFYYEGGGGDSGEIAIASGTHGTFNGSFALLNSAIPGIELSSTGYSVDTATVNITVNGANTAPVANADSYATNEDAAITVPIIVEVPGMNVAVYNQQGAEGGYGTTAGADAVRNTPGRFPNQTGSVLQADFRDGGGGSHFTVNNNFPGTGGDNYAVYVTGILRVNTAGTYTFGVFTDDNSRIRIDTGSGLTTVAEHTGCCSDKFGTPVALAVGEYPFEAMYTEGGGGDHGEFFYAPGSFTSFDPAFRLIGDSSGGISSFSSITRPGVLGNDTDEEVNNGNTAQNLTVTQLNGGALTGTSAMGAKVTMNANGSFTYDPNVVGSAVQKLAAGQVANDSFTYTVSDNQAGGAATTVGTANITVTGRNDLATSANDNYTIDENTTFVTTDVDVAAPRDNKGEATPLNATDDGVLVNDVDIDILDTVQVHTAQGKTLTGVFGTLGDGSATVTTALGGTLTINDNGKFSYDPGTSKVLQALGTGQSLVDSFTYTATDGSYPSGMIVKVYQPAGAGDLAQTDAFLAGARPNEKFNGTRPTVNFLNTGGAGQFNGAGTASPLDDETNVPGLGANADEDSFVIEVTGKILIPAAGDYTFSVNSDDGFGLAFSGAGAGTVNLIAVNGDNDNTSTLGTVNPRLRRSSGRGSVDTFGTFNFSAPGLYDLKLVNWEGAGGANLEFYGAPGAHASFAATNTWRLVGDTDNGGLAAFHPEPNVTTATVNITVNGINTAPAATPDTYKTNEDTVLSIPGAPSVPGMNVAVYRGTNAGIGSIDAARAGSPSHTGTVLTADFPGDNSGINGGQGHFNNPNAVPGGAGENYGVLLTGILKVDVAGVYTFGTYSDDASRIRIDLNQDGTVALNGTEDVVTLPGCCADAFSAGVNLAVGEYAFEAMYTEGGGGDYGEFFYAPGTFPGAAGFANLPFRVIGDASGGIGSFVSINHSLLSNDTDEEVNNGNASQNLTVTQLNGGALTGTSTLGAQVTLNADGSFTYNPNVVGSAVQALQRGQIATDTFTYTVFDNAPTGALSSTATVSITVTGQNDFTVALNNSYATNEDTNLVTSDRDLTPPRNNQGDTTPLVLTDDGVLVNDTDVDQLNVLEVRTLQGNLLSGTGGTLGDGSATAITTHGATITMNDDGTFTYNPSGSSTLQNLGVGQTLIDSFTYSATDNVLIFDPQLNVLVYNRQTGETIDGTQAAADTVRGSRAANYVGTIPRADIIGQAGGHFTTDITLPGTGPVNTENYAVYINGVLRVTVAGVYTFGSFSDDNSRIRIDLNGNGDVNDDGNVVNQTGCCNDQFGQVTLGVGDYPFEAMYTEGGGGDYGEFFYAPGAQGGFNASFRLLGDNTGPISVGRIIPTDVPATVNITVTGVNDNPVANDDGVFSVGENSTLTVTAVNVPGIQLETYRAGSINDQMATADAARASLLPVATATVLVTDMYDPEGHYPAGNFPDNIPFPGNTAGDDNNYAVFGTGILQVLVAGTYTFGSSTDDNSRLRIDLDQDGVLEGSLTGLGGTESHPSGGTVMYQPTCCANIFGPAITLGVGLYRFELVYTEGGGGSSGEFFYAPGTKTAFDSTFRLIGDSSQGIAAFASMTGLMINDSDRDIGDTISVDTATIISANGATITPLANGSFTYNPATSHAAQLLKDGETLTDTFVYTLRDANGGSDSGTVTVVVRGASDPVNDPYTVNESDPGFGVSLNVPAGTGLLANDTLPGRVGTNVALGRPAAQSTDYQNNPANGAANAVDGNFNNITHTADGAFNSWWQVNLAAATNISQILLFNRADCCGNRLSNFRVSVWNGDPNVVGSTEVWGKNYFQVGSVPQGDAFTIAGSEVGSNGLLLKNTAGNYVRVQILGANTAGDPFLSFREVQVYDLAPVTPTVVTANNAAPPTTFTPTGGGAVTVNANGSFTYDQLGLFNNLAVGETATVSFPYTVQPINTVGAVTQTGQSSGAAGFSVSATDLLQNLSGVRTGTGLNADEGTSRDPIVLTNGSFGSIAPPLNQDALTIRDNTTLTYDFDISTYSLGYAISSIDVYSGWQDPGRTNQTYTVRYSTVGAPTTFIDLASVNYTATDKNARTSLAAGTQLLATGVASLQFFFPGQQNGYVGYREIDVQGYGIAPAATATITINGVNDAPTAEANGQYSINPGQNLTVSATGSADVDNGAMLTYRWDFDNDGNYDFTTSSQTAVVPWQTLQTGVVTPLGPGVHTIRLQVSDGLTTATDTATLNISDNFTFSPVADGAADGYLLILNSTQTTIEIRDLTTNALLSSVPRAGTNQVTFNGNNDNETLVIDYTNTSPIPATSGVTFSSGAGTDGLVLRNGTVTTVTQTYATDLNGTVNIDGRIVNYTGDESVTDNLTATNRGFTFNGAAETVTLANLVAGTSLQIDSSLGALTNFNKPTDSLTINLTTGSTDTLTVNSATLTGNLTVNGSDGNDNVNVNGAVAVTAGAPSPGLVTINAGTIAFGAAGSINTVNNVALTAAAAITNTSGAADVMAQILTAGAGTSIDLDTSVATLNGTVSAAGGTLRFDEANAVTAQNITTNNGAITITTTGVGNLTVENVNSGTAATNITVLDGNLVSGVADAGVADIVAGNLTISLSTGARNIGVNNGNRLEINATTLQANIAGGSNNSAWIVDTAGGLAVNNSSLAATGVTVFDLLVQNGSLTSAAVDGVGDLRAIVVIVAVTGAGSTIGASAAAPLEINAATLAPNARLDATTAGGANDHIFVRDVADDFAVGNVNAGLGDVVLFTSVGSITDYLADTTVDVTGGRVTLTASAATAGIGSGPNGALEIQAGLLEALAGSGGILLANTGNVTVGGIGATNGLSAPADVVLFSTGGITVNEDIIATGVGSDVALSTLDLNTAGQDISIGPGAAVVGDTITLNSGDNFSASSTSIITSATPLVINIDSGNSDSFGAALAIAVGAQLNAPSVTLNSAATGAVTDIDTFSFAPLATVPIVVNAFNPTTGSGDVLNLDLTGATGTTLTIDGMNDGTYSFTNRAMVEYNSIEVVNAVAGAFDLVLNMAGFGTPGDFTLRRNAPFVGANLEIVNNTNGTIPFSGSLAGIAALTVLGTTGSDRLVVDDVNGMISFNSLLTPTAVFPDNPNGAGAPRLLFSAGAGVDTFSFNLTEAGNAQSYFVGDGAGAAAEGEIATTNTAGRNLVAYFTGFGTDGSLITRTGNSVTGGFTVVGDGAPNTMNVQANGTATRAEAIGFTPFEFSGDNFGTVGIDGGAGSDTLTLVSIGSGQTNPLNTTLSGGADVDTIRVLATSGNTGTVTMNGGAGSDQFQLYNATNTVDSIAGQVVVDGTDGNIGGNDDTLTIIDTGDTAADVVTISAVNAASSGDYQIEGINSVSGADVIFRNIDTLSYTGTQGNDTLDTQLVRTTPLHDLSTVTVNGWLGDDQFYLFTSDQAGGTTPTPSGLASGVAVINLNGDAPGNPNITDGNDVFGETATGIVGTGSGNAGLLVPDTVRGIRPSSSTAININGGQPTGPAVPTSDTIGDVLNLDISGLPGSSAIILPTVSGVVAASGLQPLSYAQIEDLNLIVNNQLINVQMGDTFVRGTAGQDLIQFTKNTTTGSDPNAVRVRVNLLVVDLVLTGKTLTYAGASNDFVTQANVDRPAEIYGEGGDDYISGAMGNDFLVGGLGADQINASGGDNIVWGDNAPTIPSDPNPQDGNQGGNDSLSALGGNDVFYGGAGDDQVSAGPGDDYISGGLGNDTLGGAGGDDRIYGGGGNDILGGGDGNDLLSGGEGIDRLLGNTGNDVLIAGGGADDLDGGVGNDVVITGRVTGENSSFTSVASTSTYDAPSYSNPADNDAALLTLLMQWGSTNVLGAVTVTHDGADDDVFGGTGDDDFCWEAVDLVDDVPAINPADFGTFGMGADERFGPQS